VVPNDGISEIHLVQVQQTNKYGYFWYGLGDGKGCQGQFLNLPKLRFREQACIGLFVASAQSKIGRILQFTLQMLHPRNPPNHETQFPRYLAVQIEIDNLL